jgi:hypothetical protein
MSLAPRSILNLDDHGLQFICTLRFDLSGVALLGAYDPASISLRVIGSHKPPLHDKAVVLEEMSVYIDT